MCSKIHANSPPTPPLLQYCASLPGPATLLDPPLHRRPGQQRQAGLRGHQPARTLLHGLPGRLLHAHLQTQGHAGGQHEERCERSLKFSPILKGFGTHLVIDGYLFLMINLNRIKFTFILFNFYVNFLFSFDYFDSKSPNGNYAIIPHIFVGIIYIPSSYIKNRKMCLSKLHSVTRQCASLKGPGCKIWPDL